MQEAWDNCEIECALRLLEESDHRYNTELRRFACWCARNTPITNGTTWELLNDASKNCVDVAERLIDGKATLLESSNARSVYMRKFYEVPLEPHITSAYAAAYATAAYSSPRKSAGEASYCSAYAAFCRASYIDGDAAGLTAAKAAYDAHIKVLRELIPTPVWS